MPNIFASVNPHVIDTAFATPASMGGDDFRAWKVRWVAPLAAPGDRVVILNGDGDTVWEHVATGPTSIESLIEHCAQRGWYNGYSVPTLSTGTLYISFM